MKVPRLKFRHDVTLRHLRLFHHARMDGSFRRKFKCHEWPVSNEQARAAPRRTSPAPLGKTYRRPPKLCLSTLTAETMMISAPHIATVRNGLKFRRLKADDMICRMTSAIRRPPTLPKPPKGSTPPRTAARIVTSK